MELVLLFPAALFMTAVIVRNFQPLQYEPAHTAQMIVTWYAGRVWTLWVLLIGLPFTALVIGCVTLVWNWADRQQSSKVHLQPANLIIAAATLAEKVILCNLILFKSATGEPNR
jgi:hypothetical protein